MGWQNATKIQLAMEIFFLFLFLYEAEALLDGIIHVVGCCWGCLPGSRLELECPIVCVMEP